MCWGVFGCVGLWCGVLVLLGGFGWLWGGVGWGCGRIFKVVFCLFCLIVLVFWLFGRGFGWVVVG